MDLFKRGSLVKALEAADRAIALGGDVTMARKFKAMVHVHLGDAPAAAACFRAILRETPDPKTHSRLLMAMQYCDSVTEEEIFAEVTNWARTHASRIAPRHTWPRVAFDPGRRLAIGVISADFRLTSTPFLALPLFQHWPPDWSVTLYSSGEPLDEWTDRFRRTCANFVDIVGCDDKEGSARILRDRIDVLIDLDGHTLDGRLGIFARKPAPVQIAWLDYVGTTGLATMDAIIADAGHLPLAEQCWYVEPIRHVRDNLYRYQPPDGAPAVGPLPAARNGFVTFGCFNIPLKLSETTLSQWAGILNALPSSRLVLSSLSYRYLKHAAGAFAVYLRSKVLIRSAWTCAPGRRSPSTCCGPTARSTSHSTPSPTPVVSPPSRPSTWACPWSPRQDAASAPAIPASISGQPALPIGSPRISSAILIWRCARLATSRRWPGCVAFCARGWRVPL